MSLSEYSTLRPFVARLTTRSILSSAEQDDILDLPCRVTQLRPNEDFLGIGEHSDHASFVAHGLVGRFDQNGRGDRQITALHISGDMPDLHSVVQPKATSALQALCSSTVVKIPHSALRALAAKKPAIAEAFWRDSVVDAMILAQWVVNVGRRDAKSRIAHLFCEMACRYKIEPEDGIVAYDLPMTQAQMADATGLTPVHVNRTLRQLSEIGTTFRRGRIRIKDWDTLVEIGDFDRTYLQEEPGPGRPLRLAS